MSVRNIPHAQQRVLFQRHEVRKIGQMRQADDRRVQRLFAVPHLEALAQGVLILDVHLQVRHDAHHGQMGLFFQHRKAGAQNFYVSTEFIDDESLDAPAFFFFQQLHRAVELGEHAAPVDVAHQKHRRVHHFGEAHVHDVLALEVDLCRAARALDDDDVSLLGEAVICLQDVRHQLPFRAEILRRFHLAPHLAVDDDLTAHITAGLQEDGVHPHVRLDTGGLRLHHLRPAHLEAVFGDEAVQSHVLALERHGAQAVLRKDTAERRAEQAFACTAHRPLHHDAFCPAHPSTSFISSSSRAFSGAVRTAVRYHSGPRPG